VGASITLTATAIAVEPGGEASLDFKLRNTGTVVDEFSLNILGDASGWATVQPPTMSLFPGAEESGKVTFRPPRSADPPAGAMPFGFHALSREDPDNSTVEEGVIDVAAFLDPFAELVPRTSRGSRSATHDLAVDNRGNTRLNADIEASDADRLLRFDVRPPGIVVEPGMAGFAKVGVKPAKRFWRGTAKTRPFQLIIRPEGVAPVSLDGTLVQEAILPPWLGRALVALIGLIILAVLIWFLFLKPSIESAVSEAVASPIADLRDDVNGALDAAGLPTMGPDDGGATDGEPTPTPEATPVPGSSATPEPTPGTPTIPGLGTPVDGRLVGGSPPFSPDGTLFITDLVFSNPSGHAGTLTLSRDSTDLIDLRLENFRDLDFHFVTPIVVPEGSNLVLDLSCTDAPPCDPAVLYSGYLRPS
jgi:hypothetical protein